MSRNVVATWEVTAKAAVTSIIVPDGCRDLIRVSTAGDICRWFVSPLYDETCAITLSAGTAMTGFRLRPGAGIDERKLLISLAEYTLENEAISERLDTYVALDNSVDEALYSLSSAATVARAAKQIGITQRTLQRLVLRGTGRSPVYWLMLARARTAARALNGSSSLADIAELSGYADQAHMSRAFKRWFNVSPAALRQLPDMLRRFHDKGYDAAVTGVHNSIKKPLLSET